jgi:hypothetical protein
LSGFGYNAAVNEFRCFISGLPDEMLAEKVCGPRPVLAHLVFWLESYVTQVEDTLAGDTPELPQGRFDDLNAKAVETSRGVSTEALLHRHQTACERLGEVAYTYDSGNMILT